MIRSALRCALTLALLFCAASAHADINPWIASAVYDPEKWDSGGPYAATPWVHPPPYQPGMGWGMLNPSAAFETGDWREASGFTGSWGGTRDALMRRGVFFSTAYFGQLAANPVGGAVEGGVSWRGNLAAGLFADLERIAGWSRTYFVASADWKAGNPTLSTSHVGNQLPVQLDSFDDPNVVRLVHLAVSKQLFGNDAELSMGRIITGEDFATVRLACTSLNQGLCGNPIAAAQNIAFPTFPSAVWGASIKLKPGTRWYAQAGSYLVSPDFRERTDNGVNFSAPDGSGALSLAEVTYLTGSEIREPGLPGRYKLGGWYSTTRLPRFNTGGNDELRGWWGLYLMGQQMLWAQSPDHDQGISVWGAVSYAPPSRNLVQIMAAGGVLWQGLVPHRPHDGLVVIAAYTSYSDRLADRTGELLLETNYRFTVTPWLWLEPDVQVVLRPSGEASIRDALVVGFAVGVVF